MPRRKKRTEREKRLDLALAPARPLAVELIQINQQIEEAISVADEVELNRALERLKALTQAADFSLDTLTYEEQTELCWFAYLAGNSHEAIANLLGRAGGGGKKFVADAIKSYRDHLFDPRDDAAGLTAELFERTLVAIRAIYPRVLSGQTEAIKVYNQLIQTLSRLGGLDVQKQLHGLIDQEGREVSMLRHPALVERRLLPDGSEDDA